MKSGKKSFCLVYCPCASQAEASNLAEILLKARLIACANLYPGVLSRYWWEGKIETASECVAIFKTRSDLFEKTRKIIEENHSYTKPAILKLALETANAPFLQWMDDSVVAAQKNPSQNRRTLAGFKKIK